MKNLINNKKLIILILAILVLLGGCGFGAWYYLQINKVISVITMDINPSIAISVNKNEKVLKIESLNNDAKEIIKDKNLKGQSLETALTNISEALVEKGYLNEEDNSILINVNGKVNKNSNNLSKDLEKKVTSVITKTLKEQEIECNVIIQQNIESAKENAKKYGITESKASYIEGIIKDNEDLTFEELKDKTINEINAIKEQKKEDNIVVQNDNSKADDDDDNNGDRKVNNSNSNSSSNKYYTTAPSKDDPISEWCLFNKALHPQTFSYNYDGIVSMDDATSTFYSYLGIDRINSLNAINVGTDDNRCTYCKAYLVKILTEEYKYSAIIDSVNKKIYDVKKEPVVLNITKEQAVNILLNHFNVTIDDTTNAWAVLQFTNDPSGDVFNYNTNLIMKDGTDHIATINAMTGQITWLVR